MAKSIGLQAYQSNDTEAICRVIDGDISHVDTFWLFPSGKALIWYALRILHICGQARKEGILAKEATDSGYPIGY
ncbi:hypothetical protein [Methylomonas rhizoryzae]|uniref:hypothetical protein n=1 Tax=Methylomonas rhizoryzae TaxID=2608981 RepID=UPI0018D7D87C|nr:hypothetical protein [Methylomonas rhizoryzae]